MAALRAVISRSKAACPPEAQRPRRRVVLVSIAAWMASIGVLDVPPCYEAISNHDVGRTEWALLTIIV